MRTISPALEKGQTFLSSARSRHAHASEKVGDGICNGHLSLGVLLWLHVCPVQESPLRPLGRSLTASPFSQSDWPPVGPRVTMIHQSMLRCFIDSTPEDRWLDTPSGSLPCPSKPSGKPLKVAMRAAKLGMPQNSYMCSPRKVTLAPIAWPWRNLKLAMLFLARVSAGF